MKQNPQAKHEPALPSARNIRRACSRELYRTIKKMKVWVSPDLIGQAEDLYFKKVVHKLLWIHENRSNRRLLADWFEEQVAPDIADLWKVDLQELRSAFRSSFGG